MLSASVKECISPPPQLFTAHLNPTMGTVPAHVHYAPGSEHAIWQHDVLSPAPLRGLMSMAGDTYTKVSATDAIFDAGNAMPSLGGTLPEEILIPSSERALWFRAWGRVQAHPNMPWGPPDGATVTNRNTRVTRYNGLSGITHPATLPLCGVFVGAEPVKMTPDLNYYGIPTTQQYISPELNQVFFIGDGFSSDNFWQVFMIPAGARALYLGVPESECVIGLPGGYHDNRGSFLVEYTWHRY
jgi:hypothetical protein